MIQPGERFNRLVAVRPVYKKHGAVCWLFKCDCGNEHITRGQSAKIGKAKSCGCRGRPRPSSLDRRFCNKCQSEKQLSEFVIRPDGKIEHCKDCYSARHLNYVKTRRKTDPAFVAQIRRSEIKSRARPRVRIGVMYAALKQGAIKRKIPFLISRSDIEALAEQQQWHCAKTGIPLDLSMGKGQLPFGPTIDRIDNERGYEPGNIQLVCYVYNTAKNRFTDADVLTFARALIEHSQTTNTLKRAA